MRLTVVGCGDAFGTGGRLQSCYHFAGRDHRFLVDCGASALIGLSRLGLDPNTVETIFISHLHGDHYAGLVWWLLQAQHVTRRKNPLKVVGPPSIEARFMTAAEALFPGSSKVARRFELSFREMRAGVPIEVDGVRAIAAEVNHPSGAPSHALRLAVEGREIGFFGDSEWVDALLAIARGTDIYITECYGFETDVRYHMNWRTIERNMPRLGARKLLLTHMNAEMLARRHQVVREDVLLAEDGLVVDI